MRIIVPILAAVNHWYQARWQLVAHPWSFWIRRVALGLLLIALWYWRTDAPSLALGAVGSAGAVLVVGRVSERMYTVADEWYVRAIRGEQRVAAGTPLSPHFWWWLLLLKSGEVGAIALMVLGLWQADGWQFLSASSLWFALRYLQLELMTTVA